MGIAVQLAQLHVSGWRVCVCRVLHCAQASALVGVQVCRRQWHAPCHAA
jgi:hypothetical protein